VNDDINTTGYDKFWNVFQSTIGKNNHLDDYSFCEFGFDLTHFDFSFHQQDPFVISKETPTRTWMVESTKSLRIDTFEIITSNIAPRHLLNVEISTNNRVRANHLLDFCGSCIKKNQMQKYRFVVSNIITFDDKETPDAIYKVTISLIDDSKVIDPIKAILNYGVKSEPTQSLFFYSYPTPHFYEKKNRAEFFNVDTIYFKDIPDLSPGSKITFYQWKVSSFFDQIVLGSDKTQITFSFRDYVFNTYPKYSKKFGRLDFSLHPFKWSEHHFVKFPRVIKNIIIFVQERISL
jgi:hypothetical protein